MSNTANSLEYKKSAHLLADGKKVYATWLMNFYFKNTLSNEEIAEPTPEEKKMASYLFNNLNNS